MATEKMITVTFHPQAWQNDWAVDVDPTGDVTAQFPAAKLEGIEPNTYEADNLRCEPEAPEWWRAWSGPFEIDWDTTD